MDNVITYTEKVALDAQNAAPAPGLNYSSAWAVGLANIRADYPVELGIVQKVTYDSKTDRYVLTFHSGTVRVSTEVAQFLLTHAFTVTRPQTWAHMADGVIDAVTLVFVNKP